MLQKKLPSLVTNASRGALVFELLAATALLALSTTTATATAMPVVVSAAQPNKQASAPAGLSPGCPPAGFVRVSEVRDAPLHAVLKSGEAHYCVVSDLSWSKRHCTKYLPAEEYIRHAVGRPDAVYSGMAVGPGPETGSNVLLFYCLPRRKQ